MHTLKQIQNNGVHFCVLIYNYYLKATIDETTTITKIRRNEKSHLGFWYYFCVYTCTGYGIQEMCTLYSVHTDTNSNLMRSLYNWSALLLENVFFACNNSNIIIIIYRWYYEKSKNSNRQLQCYSAFRFFFSSVFLFFFGRNHSFYFIIINWTLNTLCPVAHMRPSNQQSNYFDRCSFCCYWT